MRKENFKLQKSTKRITATIINKEERRRYLSAMIDAQRAAESHASKKSRGKSEAAE
jgi:hypothetical protein